MKKDEVILLDAEPSFKTRVGSIIQRTDQIITPRMLQQIADFRDRTGPEGEMMPVAQVPTIVVEKWMREGFNILTDRNITARDIVARLKAEGLDAFVATRKRV